MNENIRTGFIIAWLVVLALAALLLVLGLMEGHAIPGPKWAQADPATSDWFKSLHNDYGTSCCEMTDGNRVDDQEWRQDANGEDGEPRYSVKLFGEWWPVDPKKVLHGQNRVGYAILWRPQVGAPSNGDPPAMYCFLPGSST